MEFESIALDWEHRCCYHSREAQKAVYSWDAMRHNCIADTLNACAAELRLRIASIPEGKALPATQCYAECNLPGEPG